MIDINYEEVGFRLIDETKFSDWISRVVVSENRVMGSLSYVFCTDEYLLDLNQKYLSHDTYTDIITFDYCEGNTVSGDIFISIDRVNENSKAFDVSFDEEVLRVCAHGVLHLTGYKDKSEEDAALMRQKEDEKIEMFHVEQ